MSLIDPRAVIEKGAELDQSVTVGPFCHIGPRVKIGPGTVVSAHAVIEGRTMIGRDNWIGPFTCIGGPPQHVSYQGEDTAVVIGDRNRIREQVTIHRGTAQGRGETRLGSDNFIMVGTHIAHDCVVGDRVIMANLATLAGHVSVEDDAVFGGFTGVHQYCRVGRVVMIAAMTKIVQDVPPYSLVGGEPPKFVGLNRVGLKRVGMSEEVKKSLRQAYRIIFAKGEKLEQGLAKAEKELGGTAEVQHLLEFIRGSSRGIIRE
jgi:UDP-N-acetylglucosamine acyltransferase